MNSFIQVIITIKLFIIYILSCLSDLKLLTYQQQINIKLNK